MASNANQASERRVVHYSGHVQGVGFRFTARGLAERYGVDGYVENLPDGRVLLVVEGTPSKLDRLIEAIATEMERFIRHTQTDVLPAGGEFTGFQVRH
jgi:acylphosphatase